MSQKTTPIPEPTKPHKLLVVRDTLLEFPELWMEVYIEGDKREESAFAEFLVRSRCKKALTPEDADMVVFTGGADVDPLLYGRTAHAKTNFSASRDKADLEMYKRCYDQGIPMFGVCRGMQFLHVMNGGALYQHVDNHYGDHRMYDAKNKQYLAKVSSVHHQACIDNTSRGMVSVGECSTSNNRWYDNNKRDAMLTTRDIEALWYPETGCFGVQGHPEYRGYEQFAAWTCDRLMDFFILNPDFELVGNKRRMKKEVVDRRKNKISAKLLKELT
jgi:GMP synthase-like glutamine amidotransferase